MQTPDLINGLFETFGGVSVWRHVRAIRKAKEFKGVDPLATAFFASWGLWNLFYYPNLNQWFSFAGGLLIVAGNAAWLYHMYRYRPMSRIQ